jgi:hypothetical protein
VVVLTCPHERYHSLAQCGHDPQPQFVLRRHSNSPWEVSNWGRGGAGLFSRRSQIRIGGRSGISKSDGLVLLARLEPVACPYKERWPWVVVTARRTAAEHLPITHRVDTGRGSRIGAPCRSPGAAAPWGVSPTDTDGVLSPHRGSQGIREANGDIFSGSRGSSRISGASARHAEG